MRSIGNLPLYYRVLCYDVASGQADPDEIGIGIFLGGGKLQIKETVLMVEPNSRATSVRLDKSTLNKQGDILDPLNVLWSSRKHSQKRMAFLQTDSAKTSDLLTDKTADTGLPEIESDTHAGEGASSSPWTSKAARVVRLEQNRRIRPRSAAWLLRLGEYQRRWNFPWFSLRPGIATIGNRNTDSTNTTAIWRSRRKYSPPGRPAMVYSSEIAGSRRFC